jgi:FkbM family methyltransferase
VSPDPSRLRVAPKHRDLVYDVGLHKGEDSLFYLRKGFRVVAIEADPDLVAHCHDRLGDFVRRGQLTIVHGAIVEPAVAALRGTVTFFKNDEYSVWGTVCEDWAERNARRNSSSRRIQVPAIDLENVMAAHGVPHYMKVDIEGADLFCLAALDGFSERPDYVSIESDRGGYRKVAHEIDLLASLGYDGFQAVEQARIPQRQRPPQPAREGDYIDFTFEPGSSLPATIYWTPMASRAPGDSRAWATCGPPSAAR